MTGPDGKKIIEVDPELARKRDILISIPGIAERSGFALLTGMPELGDLDSQAAGALSGTAPRTRRSGKWTGKAFVQGARAHVRHALYMPALAAARFNPDLNHTYKTLTARRKPPSSPLPPSCENSSSSQTPSSATTENGPRNPLDQHGYSGGVRLRACSAIASRLTGRRFESVRLGCWRPAFGCGS